MVDAFDVIVVGFGFAGGIAAIAAHDAGARVLILEKQGEPGGISICSAGGLRITYDAVSAFDYLKATNADTAPDSLLRVLADGMASLPRYAKQLTEAVGAQMSVRAAAANYPFPGHESFGFAVVDGVPGLDVAAEFPNVRGGAAGLRLFKVVLENVRRRHIEVRLGSAVERLIRSGRDVVGVVIQDQQIEARKGVVLACGGFEGAPDMQRSWWSAKPVLSAATRSNVGDGIRLAQDMGANLWHMWHLHGSYGFRHPDPTYPFGIRVKRLPDWLPGRQLREDVRMSWILVDRFGRRFANEYEPYMQDTGHRNFGKFDPVIQDYPRIPAVMIMDDLGRGLYPLSDPTWHDADVAARFKGITPRELDEQILIKRGSISEVAQAMELDAAELTRTVERWNAACAERSDEEFGRPPTSMIPIKQPPFSAARVWPIVSNTQGGPVHDERQRVLDAFGAPIPRLYAAGELGSVFGHLYLSGGNIAECFIGGEIAGRQAAREASA